jgi:maltose alpha-D-glucosyltransferase/alpha-amylase
MHRALITPGLGDDFAPQPVTGADLLQWSSEMTAELDALLARPADVLEPLRRHRDAIARMFAAVSDLDPSGMRTRVHGDLHLGQSLRTDAGWIILDFEGEPDRSPAQRRRRTSPLIDVAGMLRSFDYAAAVALAERLLPESADWEGMLGYGDAWSQASREGFWTAYLEVAGASGLLPEPAAAETLRRAFELQKAVYETSYELGHRPSWAPIPIRFLVNNVS